MKRISGFYVMIAVLFAAMLVVNMRYFRGSAFSNIGIAQAPEYRISSEKSGQILAVHVVPGQEVKAGELLVEMENRSLEIEIAKLSKHIDALRTEQTEKNKLVQSKIKFLEAEGSIKLEELEAEIQQISAELKLNRQLTEQFLQKPAAEAKESDGTSPHGLLLGSLEERKKLYRHSTSIQVEDMLKDHRSELLVLENSISLKEQELDLLYREKEKLKKYATQSGVVKQVYVRKGEELEAFVPILSISPRRPGTVVAYVVGPDGRQAGIGQRVKVMSYNNTQYIVEGEVIGFGSIIELPAILQQSTAVKAFGKEVFIQIPEENDFASGEKVLIR